MVEPDEYQSNGGEIEFDEGRKKMGFDGYKEEMGFSKCGKEMGFDEYQSKIAKYDVGKHQKVKAEVGTGVGPQRLLDPEFVDKVLGLAGEAGEVADKFKKIIRDKGGEISEEDRGELVKELGDTLWYVATVARYLDVRLSEVAEGNVRKLEKRYREGKLSGEGDNR